MSEENKEKKKREKQEETFGKALIREENYYQIKLNTCKETLDMAKRRIEHLDIQILKLKERFDHDKKVYDDQAKHMQNIITDMEKRIPDLEKKLKQGYTTIDLRTGKSYKSFKARHIEHLQEKSEWAKNNQKLLEKKYQERQALKKKKRLTPEQQEIKEAEEIRESLQGKDEIKQVYEKQMESLQKKADTYEQQLEELIELTAKKKAPISKPKITSPNELDLSEETEGTDFVKIDSNELKLLLENHQDWIEAYGIEEGGLAVWQGRITNGFRQWLESKGYK